MIINLKLNNLFILKPDKKVIKIESKWTNDDKITF